MSDPLFGNKVAAGLLVAALLFFGVPQLADRILGGGAHHGADHGELKLAYPIEFKAGGEGGGEAAAPADLGTLLAAANPAGGERRAGLCKSCHTFEKGGANGTGPNLWGVVGAAVAAHPGFNYTAALKSAGGEWTYERLDAYIANSQGYIPGTAMVQRVAKAEQRAEILAFLATLSDSPVPFPAPVAPAAVEAPTESEMPTSTADPEAAPTETGDAAGEEPASEQPS